MPNFPTAEECMDWNAKRNRDNAVTKLGGIIRDLEDIKQMVSRWEPGQAMAAGLHNAAGELLGVAVRLAAAEGFGDAAQVVRDFRDL